MVSYLRAMLKTEVWFYLNEIELAIFDHIVADSPPSPETLTKKTPFSTVRSQMEMTIGSGTEWRPIPFRASTESFASSFH
jgi:hypothetical protein